jgi:MFS family permease
MHDRSILYGAAFLRSTATGLSGVLLGLYLSRLQVAPESAGWIVTAGLSGAALAALIVTRSGDRLGRRRTLVTLSLLSAIGGFAAAWQSNVLALAVAAFAGMLNGMGRDRGAALILDQAILPSTAPDSERTRAFAWYNIIQDVGHALGGLLAALPQGLTALGWEPLQGLQGTLVFYAVLHLGAVALYLGLSAGAERSSQSAALPVTLESRRVVFKISALFAVDSIAGGFLTSTLLTYFFATRFAASESAIAALFFAARIANAVSHLGAAWLAKRIGLVNTMVFTHIPSSLLLVTVGFAPNFPIAALLFLLREGLVEMDVPTRTSYVMAVVKPHERTFAAGVTNLVRLGGWAVAPGFAGLLMGTFSLSAPLEIGAAMKIGYDLLLYRAFRKVKPPEER